ncbi:alginate lyase family protein [Adhaeribacter swui]|uniref:Alginate lyase family protein n=1 Tax=Adhaeribacter swui TaxID=2086471 RepID=A0A7G7G5G4_9BACT|nr:alginate lyase family protein [Adhaeribacter swui]QNF32398.1 alginate lyase family protein [Adhaeribacter swui]
MKAFTPYISILFVFFFLTLSFKGGAQVRPKTFIMNADLLMQNRFKINTGNEQCLAALKVLLSTTAPSLARTPYTIVKKTIAPPSGDKHDYMSLAPYWWPDPNSPDGLPYIRKDGQSNPEGSTIKDNTYIRDLSKDIRLLGLSYYFTNDEKYAKKATELLKVFFLNSATRMNPNLNFCQIRRGVMTESGVGTVDTEHFTQLIDGVQLLAGSRSWTKENHAALQNWFKQYLNWLLTSAIGKDGATQPNNISTYYNLQVITYALFVEDKALAKSIIEKQVYDLLENQFSPTGEQKLELARTNSWTYCNKNLKGWFDIASAAEILGINLWHYTSPTDKSLKKAFQWMVPYGAGDKSWTFDQIGDLKIEYFTMIARTGSAVYKDVNVQSILAENHAQFVSGSYMELLTSRYY